MKAICISSATKQCVSNVDTVSPSIDNATTYYSNVWTIGRIVRKFSVREQSQARHQTIYDIYPGTQFSLRKYRDFNSRTEYAQLISIYKHPIEMEQLKPDQFKILQSQQHVKNTTAPSPPGICMCIFICVCL